MSISAGNEWSYEVDDGVVVCDQRGFDDASMDQLEEVMAQFDELASDDYVTGSVTIMDEDANLDAETQSFLKQNSPTYDRLGIERVALVSEGIGGLAVKSLVELDNTEIETFDERGVVGPRGVSDADGGPQERPAHPRRIRSTRQLWSVTHCQLLPVAAVPT